MPSRRRVHRCDAAQTAARPRAQAPPRPVRAARRSDDESEARIAATIAARRDARDDRGASTRGAADPDRCDLALARAGTSCDTRPMRTRAAFLPADPPEDHADVGLCAAPP